MHPELYTQFLPVSINVCFRSKGSVLWLDLQGFFFTLKLFRVYPYTWVNAVVQSWNFFPFASLKSPSSPRKLHTTHGHPVTSLLNPPFTARLWAPGHGSQSSSSSAPPDLYLIFLWTADGSFLKPWFFRLKLPFTHTHTSLLSAPGEPHNPSETGTRPWHIPAPNPPPGSRSPESELRSLQWPEDPVPHLIFRFPEASAQRRPLSTALSDLPMRTASPLAPRKDSHFLLCFSASYLLAFITSHHITSRVMACLLCRARQPRAEIWSTFFHCSVANPGQSGCSRRTCWKKQILSTSRPKQQVQAILSLHLGRMMKWRCYFLSSKSWLCSEGGV